MTRTIEQNYSYYRYNRGCKIKEKRGERDAVNGRSHNIRHKRQKKTSSNEEMRNMK